MWKLWMCDHQNGKDFMYMRGTEAEMRKVMQSEFVRGRDVWLIDPNGKKHLPEDQACWDAVENDRTVLLCQWTGEVTGMRYEVWCVGDSYITNVNGVWGHEHVGAEQAQNWCRKIERLEAKRMGSQC